MITNILILIVLALLLATGLFMWRLSRSDANPELKMPGIVRLQVSVGSIVCGGLVYALVVLILHAKLVNYVADHALPPEILVPSRAFEEDTKPEERAAWAAVQVLDERGAADARKSSEALAKRLLCSGKSCVANPQLPNIRSAVDAAIADPASASSVDCAPQAECASVKRCPDDDGCAEERRTVAGWIVGGFACPSEARIVSTIPSCSIWQLRPTEAIAPQDAAARLGHDCGSEADEDDCHYVTMLLQGALDDPESRSLQVRFGMFYGLGRLLVIVLAIAVTATLCWRRRVGRYIEMRVKNISDKFGGDVPSTNELRKDVSESLLKQVNPSHKLFQKPPGPSTVASEAGLSGPGDQKRAVAPTESPLANPVGALIDHARYSHHLNDATRVRDVETQSRQELVGWWEFIFTVITVFPVIGLAATLHGLIHAFAQADRIAAAAGDARAAAIRTMVGELSASFSTTFIALLVMSVLTLLAMRWKHAEERAFTRAVELVDDGLVFRPKA